MECEAARTSPCACFADGMALATLAFLGQRPLHHASEMKASSARAAYDAAMAAYGLFRVEPIEQRRCVLSQDEARAVARRTMAACNPMARSFEAGNAPEQMAVHNTAPGGASNCR